MTHEVVKLISETISTMIETNAMQRKTIDILTYRLNDLQKRVRELELQANSNGSR
jgi:hypothetical protein